MNFVKRTSKLREQIKSLFMAVGVYRVYIIIADSKTFSQRSFCPQIFIRYKAYWISPFSCGKKPSYKLNNQLYLRLDPGALEFANVHTNPPPQITLFKLVNQPSHTLVICTSSRQSKAIFSLIRDKKIPVLVIVVPLYVPLPVKRTQLFFKG